MAGLRENGADGEPAAGAGRLSGLLRFRAFVGIGPVALEHLQQLPRHGRVGDDQPDLTAPIQILFPQALTADRSEEHTSELQSRIHLVCRLLLEKKNWTTTLPDISQLP